MAVSNLRVASTLETGGIQVFQPCASKKLQNQHQHSQHQQTQVVARSHISDEIVKEVLQFILETKNQPLVLTVSIVGSLEVSCLIGCLRRVQHWALTSILYEFRLFSPNSSIYDVNRQFIEKFDISLVTFPQEIPNWLKHEIELWKEETNHITQDNGHEDDDDRFYYYSTGRVPLTSNRISDVKTNSKTEDV